MSTILVAIGDLLFGSKVDAASAKLGITVDKARRNTPLVDEVRRTGARRVLLDLAAPGFGGPLAVKAVRSDPALKDVEVVGYCRHTAVELIKTAQEAGCSRVLSQGEFSAQLPELLTGASPGGDAVVDCTP